MTKYDIEVNNSADRVRRSTSDSVNNEIDRQTDCNIEKYAALSEDEIRGRILELDKEWDIERVLEINASTIALTGLALGVVVNKKWFALPAGVLLFLMQHSIQGWCPPLPILRRLGIRTRGEIDYEKYSLINSLD
ncbi:DUF2892 domain-containing protein [Methylobacillus caricis]|uniref:DUF2892 domain-containing protein n=1 Tax=Methylobacillus caricis TaxID=1971611 RepID=UPI001D000A61|nr:DUF2892 domain-containing protein [Methylobacillus caricis]MCB5186777.1 DUF2892 domain-containing protein [Methylobacillus caricis]